METDGFERTMVRAFYSKAGVPVVMAGTGYSNGSGKHASKITQQAWIPLWAAAAAATSLGLAQGVQTSVLHDVLVALRRDMCLQEAVTAAYRLGGARAVTPLLARLVGRSA
jgi:lipid-binding SYLF domain-containing protein